MQVRLLELGSRAQHEARRKREAGGGTTPQQERLSQRRRGAIQPGQGLQRDRLRAGVFDSHEQVILQIRPDAWQIGHGSNAQ